MMAGWLVGSMVIDVNEWVCISKKETRWFGLLKVGTEILTPPPPPLLSRTVTWLWSYEHFIFLLTAIARLDCCRWYMTYICPKYGLVTTIRESGSTEVNLQVRTIKAWGNYDKWACPTVTTVKWVHAGTDVGACLSFIVTHMTFNKSAHDCTLNHIMHTLQ